MERLERLTESVIKSVLELLKAHPTSEFSELSLEQGTKEKILNKPAILERIRSNPKIAYNPATSRYKFRPAYPIANRTDFLELIRSRQCVLVDSDLLECYRGVDEDVCFLLFKKLVRAVRHSDADRVIKCLVAASEAVKKSVRANTLPKCDLYGQRCTGCSDNRGLVLMQRFDRAPEQVADDVKEAWFSQDLPHLSEIQRAAFDNSSSHHLTIASTAHILQRKLQAGRGRRKRTAGEAWRPDTLSNDHIAEHLHM